MTIEQEQRIRALAAEMRKQAAAKGPQHAFWDAVFDMEHFVAGRRTLLRKTAQEWIAHGEHSLRLQPGELPR